MPHYRYKAVDPSGRQIEGTLQANGAAQVASHLSAQGFKVKLIQESGAQPAPAATPTPKPATSRPTPIPRPAAPKPAVNPIPTSGPMTAAMQRQARAARPEPISQRAQAVAPAQPQVVINVPQAANTDIVKTKLYHDRDLYMVFTQLNSYAKAGVNPVQAFQDVASRVKRSDYRNSLLEISQKAVEGRSIADTMDRYPYLYPPGVTGLVRAGEYGAFLPEAYGSIVDQVDANRKFKRWFTWLGWITLMSVLCIPPTKLALDAALKTWDKQEAAGGAFGSAATKLFTSSMWEVFLSGAFLFQCGLVVAITLFFMWFNRSMAMRPLRHKLALITPGVSKRAKYESLGVFSWALGMVSRVGLSPQQAWQLAVAATPNLAMRDKMLYAGSAMNESTRLSEVLYKSGAMPQEMAPLVETGEMTGDVPGKLMEVSRYQMEEFQLADRAGKVRVGCWMFLIMALASVAIVWLYYGDFMGHLVPKILNTD